VCGTWVAGARVATLAGPLVVIGQFWVCLLFPDGVHRLPTAWWVESLMFPINISQCYQWRDQFLVHAAKAFEVHQQSQ
jgi:hypothetical protein